MNVTRRPRSAPTVYEASLLGDENLHYFNEGSHTRLYRKLGARRVRVGGGQ